MTTVLEIVRDAYREGNLIALGDLPSADQLEEGLTALNRQRQSVLGTEAGEQLLPIIIGRNNISRPAGFPWYAQVPSGDWFVPHNRRLYLNLTSAQTVYLDPDPLDGARFAFIDKSSNLATYNLTVNANGKTIDGATSAVFNTNGTSNEYFYRADLGEWKIVDPLISTDTWPFPEEFDDLFIIGLAIRLNPRYEGTVDPQTIEAYRRVFKMFKARYRQGDEVGSEAGLLRTPGIRQQNYGFGGPVATSAFTSGYPYPWGARY